MVRRNFFVQNWGKLAHESVNSPMLELAPIPSHKIPSHEDEEREGYNCKKEIETDEKDDDRHSGRS